MKFYLGTHVSKWLHQVDFPLFISNRVLSKRRGQHYPAITEWCLDSGGYGELNMYGRWQTSPKKYVQQVYKYIDEIGGLVWVAPQDWMCEPHVLRRTGLTVKEHQKRTVHNYLMLKHLASDLPFIPVLQGYTMNDYFRCVDLYEKYGVDLTQEATVGVGSVCRRQSTAEIGVIMKSLASIDIKLHGFGVKIGGLDKYGQYLVSADSMAWSRKARHMEPLPGCIGHINCANCLIFADQWRLEVLQSFSQNGT